MKSLLIAIKPKWCAKIMNGEKTIEIRKNKALAKAIQKLIDEYGYADIYVYCSKDDDLGCIKKIHKDKYVCGREFDINDFNYLSSGYNGKGKVLFKFRCYKVEEIYYTYLVNARSYSIRSCLTAHCFSKECCLEQWELEQYLKGEKGYAIHISDLEIFDKPKELNEFYKVGFDKALKESLKTEPYPICSVRIEKQYQLTKAPQSFMYVESEA